MQAINEENKLNVWRYDEPNDIFIQISKGTSSDFVLISTISIIIVYQCQLLSFFVSQMDDYKFL